VPVIGAAETDAVSSVVVAAGTVAAGASDDAASVGVTSDFAAFAVSVLPHPVNTDDIIAAASTIDTSFFFIISSCLCSLILF
jgi:hypothetical protein